MNHKDLVSGVSEVSCLTERVDLFMAASWMALWHSLESGSETSRLIGVVATGSGEPREITSLALANSRLQICLTGEGPMQSQ